MKPDTAEQSPTARRFLRRMTLPTAWGEGLDGYDLGVLSVVLPLLSIELGVSPIWAGLIGASSLIGIFFGAPIVGHLTDRFGRRLLFLIDIAASVVLNILQGVVTEPWQLFVVRLLIGVAIGAEYAIGAAMLAEFAPSRGRGRRLGALVGMPTIERFGRRRQLIGPFWIMTAALLVVGVWNEAPAVGSAA